MDFAVDINWYGRWIELDRYQTMHAAEQAVAGWRRANRDYCEGDGFRVRWLKLKTGGHDNG